MRRASAAGAGIVTAAPAHRKHNAIGASADQCAAASQARQWLGRPARSASGRWTLRRPLVFHPQAGSELAARLRGAVQGEVLFDRASRGRYSTDASIYQVEPVGVLMPASEEDVRAAIDICRELRVPVLPRGAGSSQCGQTVGAALVIDHTKHLNQHRQLRCRGDDGHRRARHRARRAQRLAEAAWPVVPGRRQHLGAGDAGRNGRQQLLRLALDRLRQHGAQRAGASTRCSPTAPTPGSGRKPRWTRASRACANCSTACARSRRASATRSPRRCPKVMRRVGGYNLDVYYPQSERPYTADGSVNLAHLLVGSEGTLAWTRALTLQLAPLPAHRTLGVVNFPTLVPRDGVRAAHREARAVGGRAGRPHDDRSRAWQPGLSAGDRRRAGRRTAGDPVGRVQRRRAVAAAAAARCAGRADRGPRPAGPGRAHDRRRRRRRRCGTCARRG